MPSNKEIEAAHIAFEKWNQSGDLRTQRISDDHMRAALVAVEQARAWPTEAMIDAAEMKMPQLGRLQIRFLFETMMAASSGRAAEQVRESEPRFHQNRCNTCEEPMSNDCPKCAALWQS